jgi:hypothetical protein
MKILILNILPYWIYNLYKEYILSIKFFIESYYNINVNIIFNDIEDIYSISNDYLNNFDIKNINIYDKIFYSGNILIANYIIDNIDNTKNFYYINIEQLSKESYLNLLLKLNKTINIIDYSEENIPYINNIFKNVYLFPPYYNLNISINNIVKNIDILTLTNNKYRKDVINEIKFKNSYNAIFMNECFDNIRDYHFLKTKIYINIHCSLEHKTMELIRIINLIINRVIIITQPSINCDLLFIKDYLIIIDKDEDIKIYTEEILDNYDFYYEKIYKKFNEQDYYNYVKKHYDNFFL